MPRAIAAEWKTYFEWPSALPCAPCRTRCDYMVQPNGEAKECAESHLLDDYDCCWFSAHVVAANLKKKRSRYKPQPKSVFEVKSFTKNLPPKERKVLMWIGIAIWGLFAFREYLTFLPMFNACSIVLSLRRNHPYANVSKCGNWMTKLKNIPLIAN